MRTGGASPNPRLCIHWQPFDLDYFETLYTLCDILCEVYQKILTFLGPSTTGPVVAPIPGHPLLPTFSSLLSPNTASSGASASSGSTGSMGSGFLNHQGQQPDKRTGVGLSPMLVEVVLKIDSKLKVGIRSVLRGWNLPDELVPAENHRSSHERA